jgi:hypothetical protein
MTATRSMQFALLDASLVSFQQGMAEALKRSKELEAKLQRDAQARPTPPSWTRCTWPGCKLPWQSESSCHAHPRCVRAMPGPYACNRAYLANSLHVLSLRSYGSGYSLRPGGPATQARVWEWPTWLATSSSITSRSSNGLQTVRRPAESAAS